MGCFGIAYALFIITHELQILRDEVPLKLIRVILEPPISNIKILNEWLISTFLSSFETRHKVYRSFVQFN